MASVKSVFTVPNWEKSEVVVTGCNVVTTIFVGVPVGVVVPPLMTLRDRPELVETTGAGEKLDEYTKYCACAPPMAARRHVPADRASKALFIVYKFLSLCAPQQDKAKRVTA